MATSDIIIANQALNRIGTRSTIASLTEASNEARTINLVYAQTRDEILSMAFWNFAKKAATLSLLKSAPGTPTNQVGTAQWSTAYPPPPWLYEYSYPSDCVQFRNVVPQVQTDLIGTPLTSNQALYVPYVAAHGGAVPFEAATDTDTQGAQINVILTNQSQAIGIYTMRVTNPSLFSNNFVQALICALAAKIAQPLTGDKSLRTEMFQLANLQIVQARQSDGNEGLTVIDNEALWIMARDTMSPFNPFSGQGYLTAPNASLFPGGLPGNILYAE